MGQIKNIKLHIVTDIKIKLAENTKKEEAFRQNAEPKRAELVVFCC